MALAAGGSSLRYRDLKPILETNQDKLADAPADDDGELSDDEAGYVREGQELAGGGRKLVR